MLLTLATVLLMADVQQPPQQAPPAPTALVVLSCKGHTEPWPTEIEAENAKATGTERWIWDYPGSKMLCKRTEVPMIDPDEGKPVNGGTVFALHPNFSDAAQCAAVGAQLEQQIDRQNRGTAWRVWRIGCPSPIYNVPNDGSPPYIIGYKMPDGGHEEQVTFLVDSAI